MSSDHYRKSGWKQGAFHKVILSGSRKHIILKRVTDFAEAVGVSPGYGTHDQWNNNLARNREKRFDPYRSQWFGDANQERLYFDGDICSDM